MYFDIIRIPDPQLEHVAKLYNKLKNYLYIFPNKSYPTWGLAKDRGRSITFSEFLFHYYIKVR